MLGQALDMGRRCEEGVLSMDYFLDAISQDLPLGRRQVQVTQIEDNPLAGAVWCADGLDEAVISEGLIIALVLLGDLSDEHGESISHAPGHVNTL